MGFSFKHVTHAVKHAADSAGKSVKHATDDAGKTIHDTGKTVVDTAKQTADAAQAALEKDIMSVFDDLKHQLEQAANKAKSDIQHAENQAVSAIKHEGDQVAAYVQNQGKIAEAGLEHSAKTHMADIEHKGKTVLTATDHFATQSLKKIEDRIGELEHGIEDEVIKVLKELESLTEKAGIDALYRAAHGLRKRFRQLQEKHPEYHDAIQQLGENIAVGPFFLLYSNFLDHADKIIDGLDKYRHHPPKWNRTDIRRFIFALAPDALMIDWTFSFSLVVLNTSLAQFSMQTPFIDAKLIAVVIDDVLKALGVPPGDGDDGSDDDDLLFDDSFLTDDFGDDDGTGDDDGDGDDGLDLDDLLKQVDDLTSDDDDDGTGGTDDDDGDGDGLDLDDILKQAEDEIGDDDGNGDDTNNQ
ncbi:MAG: hypothetical protein OXH68_15305 [Gammaproteobacteria bacterium]|nr:hypothetical protein [Gammaproteobacteria bacterium]